MLHLAVCSSVKIGPSIAQSKVMTSFWTMSYVFVFLLCVWDFFLIDLYMVFIKKKKQTKNNLSKIGVLNIGMYNIPLTERVLNSHLEWQYYILLKYSSRSDTFLSLVLDF